MKVAVIGSRNAPEECIKMIERHLPANCTQIVSGGAQGIDSMAKAVAESRRISFICFEPDYDSFGKKATIIRNDKIVAYSDYVLAFWDGKSKGTGYVINRCIQERKAVKVIIF